MGVVRVSCDELIWLRMWPREPFVEEGAVDTTLGAASVQIMVLTPPCSLRMTEGALPGTFDEGKALTPLAAAWLFAAAVTAAATIAAGLTLPAELGGRWSGSGSRGVDEETLLSNAGSLVLEVGYSLLMFNTAAAAAGDVVWAWPLVAGRKGSCAVTPAGRGRICGG